MNLIRKRRITRFQNLHVLLPCVILRVMALKGEANNVLEITRALVEGKESETSFEENMRLLRRSVRRPAWRPSRHKMRRMPHGERQNRVSMMLVRITTGYFSPTAFHA